MNDFSDRFMRLLTDPGAHPWVHVWLVFVTASFAGLCTALKEGKALTWRQVIAAMLNSGLMGMIVFLITYSRLREDVPFLVGISLLAGIGSASLATFLLELLRRILLAMFGMQPVGSNPSMKGPDRE